MAAKRSRTSKKRTRRSASRGRSRKRVVRAAVPAGDAATGFVMDNDTIERALRTGEEAGVLEDYFGPEDYEELRELSQRAASKRSVEGPPVLILPGITGSRLGQRKGKREDVIWLDPLELAFGGVMKIALDSRLKVEPVGVILLFYLKLKLRLRAAGFAAEFYPYDWRQSIDDLGAELADRIRSDAALDGVALVCHSMGGLVARAAMASLSAAAKDKVKRVVQLGTPNFGSFAAVQTLRGLGDTVKKLAFLDRRHSAEEIVESVLAPMPGACQLLPSPERFKDIDLFDAAVWPKTGPKPSAAVLRNVPAVLKKLADPDQRFFLIAGINRDTITGLRRDEQTDEFVFEVSTDGDGTVPRVLAEVPGVKTYYVEETHGSLPNNKTVARAVADLLSTGATQVLPDNVAAVRRQAPASRDVTEAQYRARQPYSERRSPQLSSRELRELLSDFASTETADGDGRAVAGVAAPQVGLERRLDGLVIGHRRQRRIDVRMTLGDIGEVNSHAVVVGIYKGVAPSGAAKALDLRLGGAITDLTQRRMFSGDVGEVFLLPTSQRSVRAEMVAFVGLGAFDTFNDEVLRIASENVIRTLIHGGVADVATVLMGSGSGAGTEATAENILTGFVKGLLDADTDQRFRCLTVCEADPQRYNDIIEALLRLAATPLFEEIELTFFKEQLPPPLVPIAPDRAAPARRPDPVYLLVRNEASATDSEFHTSVLGTGGKATVVSGSRRVKQKDLDAMLADVGEEGFNFQQGNTLGKNLARAVLSEEALAALGGVSKQHVVVVHDAQSSRIPWELLSVPTSGAEAISLAKEGGMSRQYVADKMSVAKWLEQRRQDKDFNVLLVVNPTLDLDGAEKEGARVRNLLQQEPNVNVTVLHGENATRPALERAFRSGKYDMVHYAGHAFFDPDDPGRSGLICAGDIELSGRDLVGLGNLPSLVFFNACEAGRIRKRGRRLVPKTAKEKIDRNIGLAEAFLRGGVANYIGTYWPVGDAAAEVFAASFYECLLRGETAGKALLEGRKAVWAKKLVDWADYIHYGSHDFVLKIR